MTKATRSRLSGLDLHILAVVSLLTAGLAAPFALGITAKGEEAPADDKKKDDEKKDAKKSADDMPPGDDDEEDDEEKKDSKKSADDEKKDDEKKDAKAASAAARPGIAACIAGALASLKGTGAATIAADLKTERDAHAATRATLTQAQADLASSKASLASTESALATLCAYVGVKPAQIAGKSSAEITAALDAKIRAEAVEQVAGLGFNPKALPAPSGSGTGEQKTKGDLFREYNALTDANARAAFYAQHKAAMGL